MAISWGSWSSTGSNRARLGLDISVSGTKITVQYWVEVQYSVYYNGLRLARSGAISGGVSYDLNTSGGTYRIITSSVTGARGKSYSFSAATSISTGSGTMSPSISRSATVPAIAPSKPATPSVGSITSTAATGSLASAPSSNGASITSYGWQVSTSSSFGSIAASGTSTGRSWRATGLSPNTGYYFRVRARNSAGWGAYSSARAFTTKVASPNAPTNVAVSRVSDTRQTVTWSRNSTSSGPYASQQVLRRDNVATGLTVVGNVSATATSFTDSTTVANRRYDYFVQARNASGDARSSSFGSIVTTPAAPSTPTVKKSGTNITVSWTPNATYVGIVGYTIQDNPDGAGWVTVATVGNVTSWTHQSADPAKTHRYRVAARTTGPTLTGTYSAASATVALQAPPNAPTLVSPSSTTVDMALPVTLVWQHNPVDASDQTGALVNYRLVGTTVWSQEIITTDASSVNIGELDPGEYEWQARTKGDHATYGPMAATTRFTVAEQPAVTFLEPLDEVTTSQFDITLTAYTTDDTGAISRVQIVLENADSDELETADISGTWPDPTSWSTTLTSPAEDGETYTLRARVRSSLGLWSDWSEIHVTVNYAKPPKPDLTVLWDPDQGGAVLTLDNPEPSVDDVEAIHNAIYRRTGEGAWTLVYENAPLNTTIVDYSIPLGVEVEYVLRAYSDLPSMINSDPVIITARAAGAYISGGDAYSHVVPLTYNPEVEWTTGLAERKLHYFAGRKYPVETAGQARTRQLNYSGTLTADEDHLTAFKALAVMPGPHLWRSPDGQMFFCSLGTPTIRRWPSGKAHDVSFQLTEVDQYVRIVEDLSAED